jgi:uncharacterized protein
MESSSQFRIAFSTLDGHQRIDAHARQFGEEEACKLLMSGDFETISLLHDKYTDLLRQYYYVGGMPEVVLKYVETDSLLEVRRIQSEILQGYDLDFSKHAPKEQVPRVRMVWREDPCTDIGRACPL